MASDEKALIMKRMKKYFFFTPLKTCLTTGKTPWLVLCFAGKKSGGNVQGSEVQAGSASNYRLAWSQCEQQGLQGANCWCPGS